MELTDQEIKLQEIKIVICNYYDVNYLLLNSNSRKPPIPYLKKMICYFSSVFFKLPQKVIGKFLGMKHSNVSIHVKTFKNYLDVNHRLKKEINELETIMTEKGIIQSVVVDPKYYSFVDLNDTIYACNENKQVLFVGMELEEIKELFNSPEWKFKVHNNTGKMFYSKIQNENL